MPSAKTVLWLLALSALAHAQPKPGDLIVSTDPGAILIADPTTGKLTTLIPPTSGGIDALEISGSNDAVQAFYQRAGRMDLVTVTGSGKQTTLLTRSPGYAQAVFQDQDGTLVIAEIGALLRLSGSRFTTLVSVPNPMHRIRAAARDADSGDFIFASMIMMTTQWRFDPYRSRLTSIASTLMIPEVVEHDLETGDTWVFDRRGATIKLMDWATGSVKRQIQPHPKTSFTLGMTIDHVTGTLYATLGDRIVSYTRNGTALKTLGPYPALSLAHIKIWGSRKLSGAGSARLGSTYTVRIHFPESPGAPYFSALSLGGTRPGISVGGGKIHINADFLFFATLTGALPGLTHGFSGVLDPGGRATASFWIPSFLPWKTHYTFSASALNPKKPGGLDLATPITVIAN